jgi:hypothetical protein
VLIGLYCRLADRTQRPWLGAPLWEMKQRRKLVWAVHIVYFGLVMVGSILIYELPQVQAFLLSAVRAAIGGDQGPLSAAGRAYRSGSIPRAAAVTFLVNFFLESLAYITLPSMIVPGIGFLGALMRAFAWGFILAPTWAELAGTMLPHSWTMLLEGEGYILAALFGLLIPIHMFQSSLGGTVWSRFGNVLLLNVRAIGLVAVVLAIAALYEAVELIVMAG